MATRKKAASHAKKPAAPARHAHLSSRPGLAGHLRLSLVSCPIALYGATSRAGDVSFHMINPETNNRIRMGPDRSRHRPGRARRPRQGL
ncbi:MAG: hypothetical protein WDN08_18275 [Rhizomicrobium sp.]